MKELYNAIMDNLILMGNKVFTDSRTVVCEYCHKVHKPLLQEVQCAESKEAEYNREYSKPFKGSFLLGMLFCGIIVMFLVAVDYFN